MLLGINIMICALYLSYLQKRKITVSTKARIETTKIIIKDYQLQYKEEMHDDW